MATKGGERYHARLLADRLDQGAEGGSQNLPVMHLLLGPGPIAAKSFGARRDCRRGDLDPPFRQTIAHRGVACLAARL